MPTRLFLSHKPFLIGHCFNQWDLFSSVWISSVVSPLHSDDIPWRVSDENLWDESLTSCHLQVLYHQTSFRDHSKNFDKIIAFYLFTNCLKTRTLHWWIDLLFHVTQLINLFHMTRPVFIMHLLESMWNTWNIAISQHEMFDTIKRTDIVSFVQRNLRIFCRKSNWNWCVWNNATMKVFYHFVW